MISSRWPRPIGTIESIDFRPVCTGWRHGLPPDHARGDLLDRRRVILALIGPLPSIGWPSELTTRPMQLGADRHLEDAARGLDRVAFGDVLVVAEHHRADRVALEVEREAEACCRGNSSISPCITSDEAVDAADAVGHRDHACPGCASPRPPAGSRSWLLISSLISEGLSCMLCSWSPGVVVRADYRVSAAAIWPRASRTEASITWSPTCTRAPPMQLRVDVDARPRPSCRSASRGAATSSARWDSPSGWALVMRARRTRSCSRLSWSNCARISPSSSTRWLSMSTRDEVARDLVEPLAGHGRRTAASSPRGSTRGSESTLRRARVGLDGREQRERIGGQAEGVPLERGPERRFRVRPRDGGDLGHVARAAPSGGSSSSACALASTSRRRIFSAPATASVATCSRSCSRARLHLLLDLALAAAMSRSPSARGLRLRLLDPSGRRPVGLGDDLVRRARAPRAASCRLCWWASASDWRPRSAVGEAVGDLLLARLDRSQQRRPDELSP